MIDFREIENGEVWELFARDFFKDLGFIVEVSPDRGPDGGRDLILKENLEGHWGRYEYKWLVSCKHYAHSNASVSENNEVNVLERIKKFNAQGFIGFYSTIPSSGLNNTLKALKDNKQIGDYIILDSKAIEDKIIKKGFAQLLLRYFPKSYKRVKPLHQIIGKYVPLCCDYCGNDLLEEHDLYQTLVGFATRSLENQSIIEYIYWVHKGKCDRAIADRYKAEGLLVGWQDIGDLVVPALYLRFIYAIINRLRIGKDKYSDKAFDRLKELICSISQKVLREMTEEEKERFKDIMEWGDILA